MPGLEDLYREIILDHYRTPRNRGELETPPAIRSDGHNPLCGDEVIVYVEVGEDGTGVEVARVGPGQVLGESALLARGARYATVTAMTEAVVYELRRADVALVGGKNSSLGEMVQELEPRGIKVPPGFATTTR